MHTPPPVLLLGAHTFLGALTAQHLRAAGIPARAAYDAPPKPDDDPREWVIATLDDPAALRSAARGCACVLNLEPFCDDLDRATAQARNLVAALPEAALPRLLSLASASNLGPSPERPATEDDDLLPGAAPRWAEAQWAAEAELLAANDSVSVLVSTFLVGAYTAPHDPRPGLGSLLRLLAQHRLPALPTATLNLCDARDLAQTLTHAVRAARPGQRYLLAGQPTPLRDLADLARAATHADLHGPDLPTPPLHAWPALPESLRPLLWRHAPALAWLLDQAHFPAQGDPKKAHTELRHDPRHPRVTLKDTLASRS